MNTKYKLSIIIPAYNAEKIIEDCLNKIIQETTNIVSEIIVVNDCSTDDTLKILDKFKDSEVKFIILNRDHLVLELEISQDLLVVVTFQIILVIK